MMTTTRMMRRAAVLSAGAMCLLSFAPLANAEPVVHLTGVVRTATTDAQKIVLRLGTATTTVTAYAPLTGINAQDLIDSAVRLTGVWKTISTGLQEPLQEVFHASSIVISKRGPRNAFDAPGVSLAEVLGTRTTEIPLHRVKIVGTVTAQFSRNSVYLTDGSHDLRVRMLDPVSLKPGDVIEAAGYISRSAPPRILVDTVALKMDSGAAPAPTRIDTARLLKREHHNMLVRTEGTVIRLSVDSHDQDLVLEAGGITFEAELQDQNEALLRTFVPGSRVEVTGIAHIRTATGDEPVSLRIILRDANDARLISLPTWWTLQRALYLLGIVVVGFVGAGGWIVALRRRLPAVERAREQAEAALRERDAQLLQA